MKSDTWLVYEDLGVIQTHWFYVVGVPRLTSAEVVVDALRRADLLEVDFLGARLPLDATRYRGEVLRGHPSLTWEQLVAGDTAPVRERVLAAARETLPEDEEPRWQNLTRSFRELVNCSHELRGFAVGILLARRYPTVADAILEAASRCVARNGLVDGQPVVSNEEARRLLETLPTRFIRALRVTCSLLQQMGSSDG